MNVLLIYEFDYGGSDDCWLTVCCCYCDVKEKNKQIVRMGIIDVVL